MVYDDVSVTNLIRFDLIKEKSRTTFPFPLLLFSLSLWPPPPFPGMYVLWGTQKRCLDTLTDRHVRITNS
jgi:hypothetical protein